MKIGYIIICRYNSSRLPGKILRPINNKPILSYIVERLSKVTSLDNIVIATSEEETDNPIIDYCIENNLNHYRGSLNNVSKRFLDCAKFHNLDYAVRINGDNFFVDINSATEMKEIAESNNYDVISNLKDRTFPKGMSIEMIKTEFYESEYHKFSEPDDFEHVTFFLYKNEESGKFYNHYNSIAPEAAGIQLAIDTEEDFSLVSNIISNFTTEHYNYGLKEIFAIYERIMSESV